MTKLLSYDNIIGGSKLSSPQETTVFLEKFKNVLRKKFIFIGRSVNLHTLTYLGITIEQVKDVLSKLTYKDYYKGPSKDKDNHPYMVWEFGEIIDNQEVYIKLSDDFRFDIAKCISFHLAERNIRYPFK